MRDSANKTVFIRAANMDYNFYESCDYDCEIENFWFSNSEF